MKSILVSLGAVLLLASCQRDSPAGKPEATAPVQPVKAEPDAHKPATLIGLTLNEAESVADKVKVPHRVISLDGESRPVTMDFREDRLNFTVVKGMVTAVKNG